MSSYLFSQRSADVQTGLAGTCASGNDGIVRVDSYPTTCSDALDCDTANLEDVATIHRSKRPRDHSAVFRIEKVDEFPHVSTIPPSAELLLEAKALARRFAGECLSSVCYSKSHPLWYECARRHVWKSSRVLKDGSWCAKCTIKLRKAKLAANAAGLVVLEDVAADKLTYQCRRGHAWQEEIKKYDGKKACPVCSEIERRFAEERRAQEAQERERLQQRLFQEARQRSEADSLASDPAYAKAFAYTQKSTVCCSLERALSVYRVLMLTDQDLSRLFAGEGVTLRKAVETYHKLARTLHPDKNSHPEATDAFIRVQKAYAEARNKTK